MRKFSAQTSYEGTVFRSKLESEFAKWFDALGLQWSYEPEGYRLQEGLCYLPDFYLPAQKAWFECKGVMLHEDEAKLVALARESNKDVYVGSSIRGGRLRIGVVDIFNDGAPVVYAGAIAVAKCRRCRGLWLMPEWGSWACRCCGHYDGNAGFEEVAVTDYAGEIARGGVTV